MGAAHSRARPGTGPTKGGLRGFKNDPDGAGPNDASRNDYFILCLKNGEKTDKIKVVNAAGSVHKMLTTIIKRNMVILKSGWDRHLVFSYKLQKSPRGRHALIQLTAELLLTLYRLGWEPMTPIDLPGPKTTSTDNGVTVVNLQTAICFRRKNNNLSQEHLANNWTPNPSYNTSCDDISMLYPNTMGVERHDCLCLETYSENFLGFHDVPNTLLLDLVQCMSSDWQPGLTGISAAVYSVISDYCSMDSQYPVLSGSIADDRRYLQLKGSPWSQSEEGEDLEDAICAENLTLSLIACLAKSQYKLQISINMDSKTRVFFFIKDKETKEIRLPSVGVGLGDKNSLYVHPTTITRTQTSFFRSRNKNRGKSIRKRIRASMRRKSTKEKQKKLEAEMEAVVAAATAASEAEAGIIPNVAKPNRKTSNFLTVEDNFQHLTIHEVLSE